MESSLKAIDFFCGSGGMTSGFQKAGIHVLAGIDIDQECKETYELNNKNSQFIPADIKTLTFEELEEKTKIVKNDDDLVFIGCSPCQYWSIMNTDRKRSHETKNLLSDFQKFVKHFKPGFVVIENVPGILTTKEESPLPAFLEFLTEEDYAYDCNVIKVCHYGVPQTRRRFILVATRIKGKEKIKLPEPDTKENLPTVRQFISVDKGFPILEAGNRDNTGNNHTVAGLREINIRRLELTDPDGGTRVAWSKTEYQIPAYKNRDNQFKDIYGRMHWDQPGPTITTKFFSISNGRFGHPEQNRAISLREGATLQTFDKNYRFMGKSIASNARMIGNAVPPELARKLALSLLKIKKERNI